MGRLIYATIASLDGYVADRDGNFDWAEPDEEVHAFVNRRQASIGTFLFGRRMYDTMAVWEDEAFLGGDMPPAIREFATLWRGADKIVYSTTLTEPRTARTRLVDSFDAEQVRRLTGDSTTDVAIAGPTLAAQALRAHLIDEIEVFLVPVIVGGGTAQLPDDLRLDLDLVDAHRFGGGVMYLRYRVRH